LEQRLCDDGDPTTLNDTCIDGVCMGNSQDMDTAVKFLTLGRGDCVDRNGRRMAAYAGDVQSEAECEATCRGDPQCVAYAYAFPLCKVYGTVRTQVPLESSRDWAFQAATSPPAVVVEEASYMALGCTSPTTSASCLQQDLSCRRKGWIGDREDDAKKVEVEREDVFGNLQLAGFSAVVIFVFFAGPAFSAFKRCCLRNHSKDAVTSVSEVAQFPELPLEQLEDDAWTVNQSEPVTPICSLAESGTTMEDRSWLQRFDQSPVGPKPLADQAERLPLQDEAGPEMALRSVADADALGEAGRAEPETSAPRPGEASLEAETSRGAPPGTLPD